MQSSSLRRSIFASRIVRFGLPVPDRPRTQFAKLAFCHDRYLHGNSSTPRAAAIDDGNTEVHEQVVEGLWDAPHLLQLAGGPLAATAVDVNKVNNHGRLPLHTLCATAWYDLPDARSSSLQVSADWLIPRTRDVDAPDVRGVRPLHLAAMVSEWLVRRLLAAGADITSPTPEGLTALHLAARAREANIVGLLIGELRGSSTTIAGFQNHLDARDQAGRTALFHACRSGRPESVALLLAAGADVTAIDHCGETVFDACCEFEVEQNLWEDSFKPDLNDYSLIGSNYVSPPEKWYWSAEGGVGLSDSLRPWVAIGRILKPVLRRFHVWSPEGDDEAAARTAREHDLVESRWIRSPHDTTRLDEILHMLLEEHSKRGTDLGALGKQVDGCITRCRSASYLYSMRCFQYLKRDADGQLGQLGDAERNALVEHENQILSSVRSNLGDGDRLDAYRVTHLLRLREYRAVELLLHRSLAARERPRDVLVHGVFEFFAQHGFANLLNTGLRLTEDVKGATIDSLDVSDFDDPLLYQACQRELPNADVLRALVAEGKVDINAPGRTGEAEWSYSADRTFVGDQIPQVAGRNTALHEAAKGCHWWHAEQAIPYLLSAGADRGVCNEDGETPLQLAWSWRKRCGDLETETFAHEAREMLQ